MSEMEPHYYDVDLNWTIGREGRIFSPVLTDSISIATPPEFPNGIAGIWSPEHLFTAAVVSCYMTTFLAIAENSKLAFSSFSCRSKGKLEKVDGKFMMTEIYLEPTLSVSHSEDREKALRILNKAESACLISHSIKSSVILHPSIIDSQHVS
jgi:peroxiredoxin-like protein